MDLIPSEIPNPIPTAPKNSQNPTKNLFEDDKNIDLKPENTKENLLQSEAKYQISATIPTHKQLKAGITVKVLEEKVRQEEKAEKAGQKRSKNVKINDSTTTLIPDGDNENDENVFLSDDAYETLKKRAKLSPRVVE